MAVTRPTPEASWARASTGCWRSIPMRCWRCARGPPGPRLGQRSDADAAVPNAFRCELHRQRRHTGAELRPGLSGWGASACERHHAARQIRRRVRLTLVDLWRNGNVPIQVVSILTTPRATSGSDQTRHVGSMSGFPESGHEFSTYKYAPCLLNWQHVDRAYA